MEIKKDKSYFLKEETDGYEFGSQKMLGKLNKKTGVFLIGEDDISFYFQTVMPVYWGGQEISAYVFLPKDEAGLKLEEHFC